MVHWFWEQVKLFWDIFGPGGILALVGLAGFAAWIADRLWCAAYARRDRKQAEKQAQEEAERRIFAEAQAVATAADELVAQEEVSRDVMGLFERVAAAAWRGEVSE